MASPNLPDDSDKASSQSESAIKDDWQRATLKKAILAGKQPEDNMIVFFPIGGHLERGFQGYTGDKEFKRPLPGTIIFWGRAHVQIPTGKTVGHQTRSKKLRRPGSGFWRGAVND